MTDPTLSIIDLEFASIVINATLLLGLGLCVIVQKAAVQLLSYR